VVFKTLLESVFQIFVENMYMSVIPYTFIKVRIVINFL